MEERQLNFNRNEDPTLEVLSEKQAKDLKKSSDDLRFAMVHLLTEVKDGRLDEGMKETMCSLLESHVGSLTKSLGYEGVLHREKEERFKEIRELNSQNRELRKQLGGKASAEDVRESLKNLLESFNSWWNINGFGHSSDESFGPYGFKATLSGMITEAYRDRINVDSTEEGKIASLTAYGFQIRGEANNRHGKKILYNDHNMQLLEVMLKSKYPSACIHYSKAWHGTRNEDSEIREIEIFIRNFDDLFESATP